MKKLAVALLFCGASAFAASVTYSTSGAFSGTDCITASCTNGGASITYTPQASTTVTAPTGISIGAIVSSGNVAGGTFGGTDKFTLTISQTVPSVGTGSTSASISGSITSTSNGITLTFAPTTFSIGSVVYTLQQSTYFLVAPNTNGGVTSIQANVVAPEPATLGLLGASLAGLGIAFRRRKAA